MSIPFYNRLNHNSIETKLDELSDDDKEFQKHLLRLEEGHRREKERLQVCVF